MVDFEGKAAVITGAASGIGYAIARRLGADGCRIMLADIEEEPLSKAVADLQMAGVDAHALVTDVADYASVSRLAERTMMDLGPVHLLFNNAGVSITGPSWKMSHDDWRWVWDVNVWGVVNGIKAFLPDMLAHGEGGHVVNTGSLASFSGNGDHAPYCSSKAAVLGLSQSLYCEMEAMMTGIGVSIACPGMVATRIHQSWRNRPVGDRPWSDRESADPIHQGNSEAFQGQGIAADEVAESIIDAIRNRRFYVFTGTTWPSFMENTVGRAISARNPFVTTWGEDRRPAGHKERLPWEPTKARD